jgi:membrane-bound lytic murein transglycosylase D
MITICISDGNSIGVKKYIKVFIEMSRRSIFLLSIISLLLLLCHNSFIKDAYCQTKDINEPSSVLLTSDKFAVVDNPYIIRESREKEQPSKGMSSEQKSVSPFNGGLKEQDKEKAPDIMEEAIDLLNESRDYWIKGDLENALDLLDQAYALLLDTNGDPDIARQKDDIRLLISKQILAIYSSMHTTTSGKRSEIPHIINSDVEKEIRQFQTIEKDFFIQSYGRSSLYRPIILKELKKAGLPEELSWLPLVESGFKLNALSRARALGLWQFIPSTGYKYGLNRDEWIDERMDVEKSTRAAIDYLKELHSMFGDWLTVLAAYNCGEGRVLKVISRQHINYFDRFWDLYHQLPYETARYVPRFLATLQIVKDPRKYGIEISEDFEKPRPYHYEVVKTDKSMRLWDIALHLGTSEDILMSLNSELRQSVTPDKEYNLKVPSELAEKFPKIVDEIPKCEKPRQVFVHYRAKRGETVAAIARRYRTSVSAIMAYNDISSRKKVKAGQRLIIPVHQSNYSRIKPAQKSDNDKSRSNADITKYKVKKGDTLASIAKRFNTSIDEIKRLNRIKRKTLKHGQVIMINSQNGEKQQIISLDKETPRTGSRKSKEPITHADSKTYIVQKGDSLDRIAKKNGVSLDRILEINKLAREDSIHPGQVIIVK